MPCYMLFYRLDCHSRWQFTLLEGIMSKKVSICQSGNQSRIGNTCDTKSRSPTDYANDPIAHKRRLAIWLAKSLMNRLGIPDSSTLIGLVQPCTGGTNSQVILAW